jgi:hypothetical protein
MPEELRFKQIAVGTWAPQAVGQPINRLEIQVYGLTEDGKVYVLAGAEHRGGGGWAPLTMTRVGGVSRNAGPIDHADREP